MEYINFSKVFLFASGITIGTGGVVLISTGAGSVIGVPAVAVSVPLVAAGAIVAVNSFGVVYVAQRNFDENIMLAKSSGGNGTSFDDLELSNATTKQKGNYGEYAADYNLINNKSLKDAGYDLEPIGKSAPTSPDDKIVKEIDGIYKNNNTDSKIKYVIDEAKFGNSQLGRTKDGIQMSDDWLWGSITGNDRILKAVNGDEALADEILEALENNQVERVLTRVDLSGKVTTYRLDKNGKIIGTWP